MYREDVRKPDGTLTRRQRNVRLGTLGELPTKFAAQEQLRRRMRTIKAPTVEMTFGELVDNWQAVRLPTMKPSTGNYYRNALRSRVVPALGSRQISSISRLEVETLLAEKAQLYARNTLREIRSSLSHVLGWAVEHNWLDSNPCLGVGLPMGTGRHITRTILKPEQVIALAGKLNEADRDPRAVPGYNWPSYQRSYRNSMERF